MHRDLNQGPAYEEWHINGQKSVQLHNTERKGNRDPTKGPAYETYHFNGRHACQQYYVDGNIHRDPNEGPAIQCWNEHGIKTYEEYRVDGKQVLKPDIKIKSSVEVKQTEEFYPNGKIRFREYRNAAGKTHRNPLEGPATECWHENGQKYYQSYMVDGKYHRDPKEGPAYECWRLDGLKYSEEYRVDGKRVSKPEIKAETSMEAKPIEEFHPNGNLQSRIYRNAAGLYHRDPKEGPAFESWHSNGNTYAKEYIVDGIHHRDPSEGPAIEDWYENGQKWDEYYYVDGKRHRDPLKGPAYEYWSIGGSKLREQYYVNGTEVEKPETSTEAKPIEKFYPNGNIRSRRYLNAAENLHRDSSKGPAYEEWHENGRKYYYIYYVNGRPHRDPLEGPAEECWSKDGVKTTTSYFVDGKEVPKPTIIENKATKTEEVKQQASSAVAAETTEEFNTKSIVISLMTAFFISCANHKKQNINVKKSKLEHSVVTIER